MNGINEIYFEIGYKCNGECDYCFQKNLKTEQKISSVDKCVQLILNLEEADKIENDFQIMLFGGEPFLFLDWIEDFIRKIEGYGFSFPIKITTNGLLLSDKNVQFLILHKITPTISIDGGFLVQEEHRHQSSDIICKNVIEALKMLHNHNIVPLCQSTFTPFTIGRMFESFLFISQLGFKKWWYELESVSGLSKWNNTAYNIYRNQISQILRFKKINEKLPEIIELNQLLQNIEGGIQKKQSNRLIVNPFHKIHFSPLGILQVPREDKDLLLVGEDGIVDFDKVEKLQCLGNAPLSFPKKECISCYLNKYCIKDFGPVGQIQDSSNCLWWKILWEEYYGLQ